MRNYKSRLPLANDKWAYIQVDELADSAANQVRRIKDSWTPPTYFYHLRNGGHVAALKLHQKNNWYGMIDLSGFFNSISRHRVARCLKNIGYSYREADEFAVASTVRLSHRVKQFVLPYGFVQSPILASLALDLSALGQSLAALHREAVTLSVYVDDIIVSECSAIEVNESISKLRLAALRANFKINENKSCGPTQALTAFNIDIDPEGMKIAGQRYEEMCQKILHHGVGDVSNGIRSYVRSVSQPQEGQLTQAFPESFSR